MFEKKRILLVNNLNYHGVFSEYDCFERNFKGESDHWTGLYQVVGTNSNQESTAKGQDPQSTAILLSEKELLMPDIKSSIENTRTISYISDVDETTLKSIKALF